MTARAQISGTELQKLLDLVRDADSVELKLTLQESARASTGAALGVDPLEAQVRQVFFFDTPELALNAAGVVVRARRRQGEEADTVIKLRPVVPAKLKGLDLGPACSQCGGMMQRTGSCYTCSSCGNNTGCG